MVGLLLVKLEAALMNFGGKLNQISPCRKTGTHLHIHQPMLRSTQRLSTAPTLSAALTELSYRAGTAIKRCQQEARLLMDIPSHISLPGAAPRAVTPSRGSSPHISCSAAREGSQPANTAVPHRGSAPSAAPRSPSEEQIHKCNQSTRRYEKKHCLEAPGRHSARVYK